TMQTIKVVTSLTAFLTKTGNRSQTAGSLAVNVKMLESSRCYSEILHQKQIFNALTNASWKVIIHIKQNLF
ncbi:MAG: hypothetical protein COA86_18915, partial [Kangiella sp.]